MRLFAVGIGHYRATHWGVTIHLFKAKSEAEAREMGEAYAGTDYSVWGIRFIPVAEAGRIDLWGIEQEFKRDREKFDAEYQASKQQA